MSITNLFETIFGPPSWRLNEKEPEEVVTPEQPLDGRQFELDVKNALIAELQKALHASDTIIGIQAKKIALYERDWELLDLENKKLVKLLESARKTNKLLKAKQTLHEETVTQLANTTKLAVDIATDLSDSIYAEPLPKLDIKRTRKPKSKK